MRSIITLVVMLAVAAGLGAGAGIASAVERDSPYEAEVRAPLGIIFAPGFYGVPGQFCKLLTSDGTTNGVPLSHDEDGVQDIECFVVLPPFQFQDTGSPLDGITSVQLNALNVINLWQNLLVESNDRRFDVVTPLIADHVRLCHRVNVTGQVYERVSQDNPDAGFVYHTCKGRED